VLKPCVAPAEPARLCGVLSDRPRCPAHRNPRRRRRPGYGAAERTRRAKVVANHVQVHGYVCPGCPLSDSLPHPADPDRNPLTADHLIPVGPPHFGPEDGPLRVMCRAGNSSLGGSQRHRRTPRP
jgi:hypothetical protein